MTKCIYFKRKTQSANDKWYGFKCEKYFGCRQSYGQYEEWTKIQRDTFLSKYCFGDYNKCGYINGIKFE